MKSITAALIAGVLGCAFVHPVLAAGAGTGKETVLHSFGLGTDGSYPAAGLVDVKGTLYGTTQRGGAGSYDDYGTAFAIDPDTGAETVLHSFCSQQDCADGAFPDAALTAVKGVLYGTTQSGGADPKGVALGAGTLFSLDPGTGVETVLYSFSCAKRKCRGDEPESPLLYVRGKLYGTTSFGGAGNDRSGTVFEFDLKSGKERLLYSFCSQQDCADGEEDDEGAPAGLIEINGILYGTTAYGGSGGGLSACQENDYGCGVVFSLDPSTRTEKVLYSFCSQQGCTDGERPVAGLTAVNGMLYGTTSFGGGRGRGTVFALDPNTGAMTVLYSFGCVRRKCKDGATPGGPLLDANGKLYGTADGGADGFGMVFTLDPATGTERRLYSFGGGKDGDGPVGGLIDVKGFLYGTTSSGGTNCKYGCGTVFALKR